MPKPNRIESTTHSKLKNPASRKPTLCKRRLNTPRSNAMDARTKRLNPIQSSGVPIAKRGSLGSRREPIDGIQVGELDARGLPRADGYRHVPNESGVAGIGVQIQRAKPVGSGSETGSRGVAVQIRFCFRDKILGLRE